MNPEAKCNCCHTAICAECSPQSISKPNISFSNRAERPVKYEPDCGTKNCSIFGSHDTNHLPAYPSYKKSIKIKDENKICLTAPIGLVASSVNFKTEGKAVDIIQPRYATYLTAFARLHLTDEKEWDSQLLDDVMADGLDLYTQSQNSESAIEPMSSDIYMSHEQKILREFELLGFRFQTELMPQLRTKASSSNVLGAQGDGIELTVEDIMPALKSFLRQHKYGLLKVAAFYCMIWRTKNAYFVFDACGRRATDFQSDKQKGLAMLMCFKSLKNIRFLINHLSGLQTTDPLVLRELKLVKVVTPQGHVMQLDYSLRQHQYEIVNDDYAFLRSNLHLTLNKRDLLRNLSGLSVAVTAVVVSKIEHPATWHQKIVDQIICFGVNFCQAKWLKYISTDSIDVAKFPTAFELGQFHINLEIKDHCYQGTWRCVPGVKHSELAHAIEKAFKTQHNKIILQINYQMYAIWKKQDFIYLLDPYRHRLVGKQNDSKIYEQMEKSATVKMFRMFEVFMNVLNQLLLDSNRTSRFFLHCIKVKDMQIKEKPGQVKTVKEPNFDNQGEVLSINEHICFEEAEDLCKIALGEISDYEDDDLKSDMDEIELRTSSSEEELLEEETGAGEIGEMEDIESSSSGEEGLGHKNKSQKHKKLGKGTTAKGKEAKKVGKTRNKKGKATNDNEAEKKSGNNKKSKESYKAIKSEKTDLNEESDNENSGKQATKNNKEKSHNLKQKDDTRSNKFSKDAEKNDNRNILDEDQDRVEQKTENKNSSKGKDVSKSQDVVKGGDRNNNWKKTKDLEESKTNRDLGNERSTIQKQDLSKDKVLNTNNEGLIEDKHIIADKDKPFSSETYQTEDINPIQDKPLSRDTDLIKNLIQDRIYEDLNNAVHGETKTELGNSEKDANKENEQFETSHKFSDETVSANDNKNTNDIPTKHKKIDTFQKETETLSKTGSYSKQYGGTKDFDGTEAENREYLKREKTHVCSIPKPNSYPGYLKYPVDMVIVGSESGSYQSICKLFQTGFKAAERLLLMTPWGNFVIFRCISSTPTHEKYYFLFDGCTCNFDRFRHFDLTIGTAGLLCFKHLHNIIEYIRNLRKSRSTKQKPLNYSTEDICNEYCNKSFTVGI